MDKQVSNALASIARGLEIISGGYKHDLPAGFTQTTNLMHGANGIFGVAGVDREVFSTRIKPRGLSGVLPAKGTIYTSPIVAYMTGFTDTESADEPSGPCDDPLEAGLLKSCYQGSAFGRITRKTSPLAIVDTGTLNNRGEFSDLVMVNDPIMDSGFGVPGLPESLGPAFNRATLARLLALGSAFEQAIYPMIWTGAVANNSANNGYMEFVGLETIVGTGKTDVLDGTSCPSLDSDVKDFNYNTVEDNSDELFSVMTMIYRFVKHNAIHMGFMPVEWAWVMRSEAFNQIVDVWPISYSTYRSNQTVPNNFANNTDAVAMRQMSDDMRKGMYLKIDGVDIPVIIDDGIPEATSTTDANVPEASYASDIYLLPLQIRGGLQTTYFEYRDFSQGAAATIADAGLGNVAYVSDGGRFLWYSQFTNGCFSLAATVEPRIRLLTPQLAGRLQNVMYSPLQHFRDPLNDDPYFVNGGNTTLSNAPYAGSDVG